MSKQIKKYLSEIGRKGGSVCSERKSYACKENGKLGGRPRGITKRDTKKQ